MVTIIKDSLRLLIMLTNQIVLGEKKIMTKSTSFTMPKFYDIHISRLISKCDNNHLQE